MIPLAKNGAPLRLWKAETVDDRGDVRTEWRDSGMTVFATSYPQGTRSQQTEDGRTALEYRVLFACPAGCVPMASDRLGPPSGPTLHILTADVTDGMATCTAVRL